MAASACPANNSCPVNSTCHLDIYSIKEPQYKCVCNQGFYRSSEGKCKARSHAEATEDNTTIIIGVVAALGVVILVAFGIISWRYCYLNRQNDFEDDFASVSQNDAYDFQHPIELDIESSDAGYREMNILYVSQDNLVIPEHLRKSIGLFELPSDCVRFRSIIGKGAFGKVYIGEAHGVNDNPEWTTVAIKTLAGSVKDDEIHDFLREIELMKDIKKHRNVIEMFGCCTRCRPHCLVLEYASGGNLHNYLRSLKQKCNKVAAAQAYAMLEFEKEKFQTVIGRGEMPESSNSYSEEGTNQAEAFNLEVASKIKEELRTAIDPKELESFARQIACGMEHVAGLGIVHRDLAARNILLDDNKVLKISDFGLSREGTYIKQTCGKIPFRWLSIEAITQRLYSTASDVWAFGIVLWEICTLGDVPYSSLSDKDLKDFLLSGKRMAKVESCTGDIYEIMLECWSHLPEDRPSFTEISKCLCDLEHEGHTYVNVDSLTAQQSVDDQGQGINGNEEVTEQAKNNIKEDKDDKVLGTSDLEVPSSTKV